MDHNPQITAVEASAGSGKTRALAIRYVKLLLDAYSTRESIPFRDMLAITFTNKATTEMKRRIIEYLKLLALDPKADENKRNKVLFDLAVAEQTAKESSKHLLGFLLEHYDYFRVKTIDSFINTVVSGCSFGANLPVSFDIERDHEEYLSYSLDELIDSASTDKEVMKDFRIFLDQYLTVENKTSWFPKKNIFNLIKELYSDSNAYGLPFVRYKNKGGDIKQTKKKISELSAKLLKDLPEGANGNFRNAVEKFVSKEGRFIVKDLPKKYKAEEIPMNKNHAATPEAADMFEEIKKTVGHLVELESMSLFDCYLDIYDRVNGNLDRIASRENIVFLGQLNSLVSELALGDRTAIDELYYRIAARFRHYLLDEFQDTSRLQWRNILSLVHEAISERGTLFYVGDKKQAIYRFRGGDSELFDQIKQEYTAYGVESRYLSDNYRSSRQVVEFNNLVFSKENLSRFVGLLAERCENFDLSEHSDEIILPYDNSVQNVINKNIEGYVEVRRIGDELSEDVDDLVKENLFEVLEDLKARFKLGDIAILCRENKNVEEITSWLIEKRVPVESEKTLSIKENGLVKEIVSFLKFLDSPIDDLSFASFICGKIFIKASGIKEDEVRDFLINCKNSEDYYYKQFQHKHAGAWQDFISPLFKKAGFSPLYEYLTDIYERFGILNNFGEEQAFLMRLLELVRENEKDLGSIKAFLEYFDKAYDHELYVRSKNIDSVKVLSIHKSKGLEFGALIVPYFKIELKAGGGGYGRKPYALVRKDDGLSLVSLKKELLGYSETIDGYYIKEYLDALSDELNNSYVALTRARDELYIFIPPKAGNSINVAAGLIPHEIVSSGEKRSYLKERSNAGNERIVFIPPGKYSDISEMLKNEFMGENALKNRGRRIDGKILHLFLSKVSGLDGKEPKKVLDDAEPFVAAQYPNVDMAALKATLLKFLGNRSMSKYFETADAEVFTEKEIVDKNGHVKRIDRLILTDKEATVIDFKSAGEDTPDYEQQVLSYMECIQEAHPGKHVRGFLLFIDECRAEEVFL